MRLYSGSRLQVNEKSERGNEMDGKKLLRYSMQLAFLKQLLEKKLISDREYSLIKSRLMKDYKIVSDLLS